MPEEDIAEIIEIVKHEQVNPETKKLGENTTNWIQKMVGKSIDGSWQIGLGAAGELLATAIGKYYGIG